MATRYIAVSANGTVAESANARSTLTTAIQTAVEETFTYRITDSANNHSTATLKITLNPVNDAAVISGTATGAVTEAGGVANATAGTPTATGTLTSTDVDGVNNAFTAVSTATTSTMTIDKCSAFFTIIKNARSTGSINNASLGGTANFFNQ